MNIADYLDSGDLLILNNTRVMPVRLIGSKPSGGSIDLILVREDENGDWEVLYKGRYQGLVAFRGDVEAELFEIPGVEGETSASGFVQPGIDISTKYWNSAGPALQRHTSEKNAR